MKYLIYPVLLLLFAPSLFSQPYESIFGDHSTQWNITAGNLWGSTTNEHLTLKDTTIDGMAYKMVGEYSVHNFYGFLREDQNTGRVWYRNNQSDEEMLAMDLSLNFNDSFYVGGVWNSNPGYHRVDSVYYKDGRKHIRLDLELISTDRAEKLLMIEGITTNLGFRYQDNHYPDNLLTDLLCVFKDGEQVYGSDECLISRVDEEKKMSDLRIYPNPFHDLIVIEWEEEGKWDSYRLLDQYGRVIRTGGATHSGQKIYNLSHLPNGIYFLEIKSEYLNAMRSHPILKMD